MTSKVRLIIMLRDTINFAVAAAAITLRKQALEDNDWRVKNAERDPGQNEGITNPTRY